MSREEVQKELVSSGIKHPAHESQGSKIDIAGASTIEDVDSLNARSEPLITGSDPKRLLELSERARDIARRLSYMKGEAYALTYLGFAHWYSGDLEEARDELKRAQALFEAMKDAAGLAKSRVGLHSIEKSLGVYDQSLEHNLACLKFFRDAGDRIWEGGSLISLGSLYYDMGDVHKSLEYYEEAMRVAERTSDPWRSWMLGRALVGMGSGYERLAEHGRALAYYERSLPLFESVGNAMGEARVLNDIGSIHQETGRDELAIDFHLRSLAIRRRIGQREAQVTSLLNIGRLFVRLRDARRAIDVLEEGLALACEIQSKPKIYPCHRALSEAYELASDLPKALEHHRRFEQVKTEVFNDEANAQVKNLQTRFELEAAEREAALIHSKNRELEEKNEALQTLLQELRKTQAQLVHSEKMASLGRLVAGIAHELNSPIGALKSASESASLCVDRLVSFVDGEGGQRAGTVAKLAKENARVITEAAERMISLVKSLKTFSRLDEAVLQRTDVRAGLESVLSLLRAELGDRVRVVKEYGNVPELLCYPGELNQVFMTLLTNAVEAIDGAGTIGIKVFPTEDAVRIQISDDGRGMRPEKLERLFDFDFTVSDSRVKLSSALLTARSIVTKHHGKISVESESGKGTTFTIDLPLHRPAAG